MLNQLHIVEQLGHLDVARTHEENWVAPTAATGSIDLRQECLQIANSALYIGFRYGVF